MRRSARSRSAIEAAGLDSAWVFDHLLFRGDGETSGIHECWTILAAIAEATSRVELGTIVLCTAFRNAALQAKMAATLDEVSGGRLIFGIGCGWHDPEFEAFGYPTDHKVGRFEEALAVITGLIREGRADLDGRYVTGARRRAAAAGPARPADPHRGQGSADARADRAPRRCLEPGVVRLPGRAPRPGSAASWSRRASGSAGTRPTLTITVGVTVRYPQPGVTRRDDHRPGLSGTPDEIAAGLRAHAEARCAAPHRLARAMHAGTVARVRRSRASLARA